MVSRHLPHRGMDAGPWVVSLAWAAVAATLACLVAALGPPGVDAPAHLFGVVT